MISWWWILFTVFVFGGVSLLVACFVCSARMGVLLDQTNDKQLYYDYCYCEKPESSLADCEILEESMEKFTVENDNELTFQTGHEKGGI
jgi:hypothetical protein